MEEVLKTNVCCIDLRQDCIDYLKGLGLAVFEGSFGSVLSFEWDSFFTSKYVLSDVNLPNNMHEYHVYVGDTDNATRREYRDDEHQINKIADPEKCFLTCERPINLLDLRPYGSRMLWNYFKTQNKQKIIKIVFLGEYNSVTYTASKVSYHSPKNIGTYCNYDAWALLYGDRKIGSRAVFEDNKLSRMLYEGRLNGLMYYHTFKTPYVGDWENQKQDPHFLSLLKNEDGECISYLYYTDNKSLFVVLPQVEDKAALLKTLFENILFSLFSDYFPDIEAKKWIHNVAYELPEEQAIREKIAQKREEYEKEIAGLEAQAVEESKKNEFLKHLLIGTGGQLVKAVKTYLEWLGFTNVIDKDETLKGGEIKEEDLDLDYNGQLVLIEVKGINGTSTDGECSQIDKIVNRRMRQLDTTKVHGIYIVNNQKNVEPLKRAIPPFNETQIKDAENQSRTMVYTIQLFSLYSDVINGYITKEEARNSFMRPGLANFHSKLLSLGVPYDYYQKDTIVCLDLNGVQVSVGDTLYYMDALNKLIGYKVEEIQQDKQSISTAATGKVGIKLETKVPRNREIFI